MNRHYPLPVLNPAHASLLALATCCAGIYVPRIVATVKAAKRPSGKAPQQSAPFVPATSEAPPPSSFFGLELETVQ